MKSAALIAALCLWVGAALAQEGEPRLLAFEGPFGLPTVSFAADYSSELNGGRSTGRYIRIPNRIRWEIGDKSVSIIFVDLWVAYTLIPDRKAYTEVDLHNSTARSDGPNAPHWTVKRLDSDTADGLVRTRYHVENRRANGDTLNGTMWLAEAYNLVVEIQATVVVGGKTINSHYKLSNIQVGPQDPALFYPPPDYQRWGTGLDPMPGGKPQGAVSP